MALLYDDWDEGHARLITQSAPDAARTWEQGIFTHRRFDADEMVFEWDVMFEDASCRGAYTGLLENREGEWSILFDTDEGLRYRNEWNDQVVLFERARLRSKHPYRVVVEKKNTGTASLSLLEDGALVFQSEYLAVRNVDRLYFGALQATDGARRAKNIYIDNVKCMKGLTSTLTPFSLVNFPNPFNAETSFRFFIGSGSRVSVDIYDVSGRLVKRLYRGIMGYGPHTLFWDATNERDDPAASGVYLCVLRANGNQQVRKVILTR
jgi:hypothetical protein